MGKQKRARQKYHLSAVKARQKDEGTQQQELTAPKGSEEIEDNGWNITLKDDIFKGVPINVDELNQPPADEDDRKSVISISKSLKSFKKSLGGKTLKKEDKRKLRHELFMKKVEINYDRLKPKKKGKGKEKMPETIAELDNMLPFGNMLHHKTDKKSKPKQPKPVSKKQRGIKKAKDRQKEMEANIKTLKKVLNDSKFKQNPLDMITHTVQNNVFNEAI